MEFKTGDLSARLVPVADAGGLLDLRARLFRGGACDRDRYDDGARHLTVERGGRVLGGARVTLQDRAGILAGYAAERYDLAAFARRFPRALEVGRLCLEHGDTDVARLLMSALARLVLTERVAVLHGCASFPADGAGLGGLHRTLAPADWAPGRRAAGAIPLPRRVGPLPPMLRACLPLGARVSDHAVPDPDLGTLHVFTALPVAAVPPRRAKRMMDLLAA